jgi:hypothetical protein
MLLRVNRFRYLLYQSSTPCLHTAWLRRRTPAPLSSLCLAPVSSLIEFSLVVILVFLFISILIGLSRDPRVLVLRFNLDFILVPP